MRLPDSNLIVTVCLYVVLASDLAHAVCTQEEAGEKGVELGQIILDKMARDPAAGQAMMMKMRPIIQGFQNNLSSGKAVDWDAVCGQYEAMIEQAK